MSWGVGTGWDDQHYTMSIQNRDLYIRGVHVCVYGCM